MKKFGYLLFLLAGLAFAVPAAESLESSPWVGWRQGYDAYDRAGECKSKGDLDRAMELYVQSKNCFSAVARNFPDWNKALVAGRIRICDQEIEKLRKQGAKKAAPAPAGQPRPSAAADVYDDDPPAVRQTTRRRRPVKAAADYGDDSDYAAQSGSRALIELETELSQYRQRWRNALQEIDNLQLKLQQAELRAGDVANLMREHRRLQEKYDLLAAQYQDLKARGEVAATTETQLIELKTANDEAQRTIRKLQTDVSVRDEEYAASRREILAQKEQIQQAQNETKRLEREIERVKRLGVSAREADEWKAKVAAQAQELDKKEQEIAALRQRLATGAAGNADDAREITRLRSELSALQAAGSAEQELRSKVSSLTAEVTRLEKALQAGDEAFKQSEKERALLMEENARQGSAESVQSAELRSLRQHTAKLEADVQSWAQRYDELEKRYRTSRDSAALNLPNPEVEKTLKAQIQTAEAKTAALQKELENAQQLLKEARAALIENKAQVLEKEVEIKKLAALQKAYDELKAKLELIQQASESDVLENLKRIPGLEESLRRYEAENKELLQEVNALKAAAQTGKKQSASAELPKTSAELEKIETLLADARAAEARSNEEVAIWGYRQVLARASGNVEANRNLGMLLLARGHFDEAESLLKEALAGEPSHERTANALARAYVGKRDYDAALNVVNDFKGKYASALTRDLLLTEALAYSRSGKNAEAETAFKAVLKIDPNSVEAAHELALLLSADEKRLKEASEYYVLAKDRGGEVDSYLEELLQSVTGSDRATLDFLAKSAADALAAGDENAADWYVAELEKMAPGHPAAAHLAVIQLLLAGKPEAALAKLPAQDAGRSDVLLRAAVLVGNRRAAEAETLLKTLPEGKCAPELQALVHYLEERAAKVPAEKETLEKIRQAL